MLVKEDMTTSLWALKGSITEACSTLTLPNVIRYACLRSCSVHLFVRNSRWCSCNLGMLSSWRTYLPIFAIVADWLSQSIEAHAKWLLLLPWSAWRGFDQNLLGTQLRVATKAKLFQTTNLRVQDRTQLHYPLVQKLTTYHDLLIQ